MNNFFNGSAFSLSYYLFTLIAIELTFVIVYGYWRRSPAPITQRLASGFGVLGGVRLLLALLLIVIPWPDPLAVNQVMIVASLGVLAWMFVPLLSQKVAWGYTFIIGNTLLSLVALLLHSLLAPGNSFHFVWLFWQIILAGGIIASLLVNRKAPPVLIVISLIPIMVGSILQLILEPAQLYYVQLAEIVAYPLLTFALYQSFIESLDYTTREREDLTAASKDRIEGLISLFETTKNITASLDLTTVLDGAAKGIVEVVKVDQCAIALPEEDEASQLRIMATYNPKRAGRGEAVTFPLSEQPTLKHAFERLREVEIGSGYDSPEFRFLFALMGARDEVGPLLLQPLLLRGKAVGVVIVGNAYTKQAFGPTKQQLIKTMANQLAIAIDNARTHQLLTNKSQQLAFTVRNQEQDSSRKIAAMEAELKKSREEVLFISQRLHEKDVLVAQTEDQLEQLKQEKEDLQTSLQSTQSNIGQQTQQSQAEIDALKERISELEGTTTQIEQLQANLTEAQAHGRKLYRALRLSRAKIQQQMGMPTSVTSPQSATELDNVSWGLLVSNAQGLVIRVNTAAAHLLEREADGVLNQSLASLIDDDKWQRTLKHLSTSNSQNILLNFRVNKKFIKASITPIADAEGQQSSGHLVILYDATEEAESQRARDEFVASLSQDLRTPMTSITGYIDLLLGESVGVIADMQRKFLQRIKANIERMDLMLRDLIGIAVIDAGQLELTPVPTDIAEVIEDAVIGAKAQLEEKDIQLKLNLPDELPPVQVDPDAMHQVMANLLSNAAKATSVGGKVAIAANVRGSKHQIPQEHEERWLQVTITDSGGGIAEEDVEHVFDRFYQPERPLIQGLGETGVGLSIVKYLIEAHKGKVWLETEIGKGTSFHFTLLVNDYYNDPWEDLDVPPLDLNLDLPN